MTGRAGRRTASDPGADAVSAPTLREVQRLELELLAELRRRCEAGGLRWFVLGGTLLGAVRHAGFIPWDDDIDVGMPRPDYERFAAACERSTDARYAWQAADTEPAYPFAYGKLLLAGSEPMDAAVAHLPIQQGLFIDVFPIDGAPASWLGRRIHAVALKLAITSLGGRLRRHGVRRILALPLRAVPRRLALAVLDGLARRFPFDGSPYAVNAGGAWGYGRECQPRERLLPTATLAFEGIPVAAPGAWDAYLRGVYGDYRRLPPPVARRPRHLRPVAGLAGRAAAAGAPGASPAGAPGPSRVPGPSPAAGPAPAATSPSPPAAGSARGRVRRLLRVAVARLGITVVRAGFAVGRLRPPRPYVVLATRDAERPGGNLVAIRAELERRHPEVPVRVVGYRLRGGLGGRIATAREAFLVGRHLAAARVFVADDWLFPLFAVRPRRGCLRVQVWHAAGAFKRFGFSALERTPGGADDAGLLPMTANWDLCLASSDAAAPHLVDAFRLPRERITSALGVPRTDALYDAAFRSRATEAIRRQLALPPGRRILLYAPTFRGETIREARHPDDLDLAALRDALAPDWTLLLRLHPLVARSADRPASLDGFVVDASDWPDMNELLLVADLLVTDYSSAIFEYALLGRPMVFFTPDLEAYEGERGLYLDVPADLPGPAFATTAELAAFVAAGRFDLDAVRAFAETWFDVADGRATGRFVDRVVLPALRGEPVVIEPVPAPSERVVLPVPPA